MRPRLRVLYFVGSFEQGGAERQTAELIMNLPRERFDAHVAACTTRDHFSIDVPVFDLNSPEGPQPKTFVSLVRLVRKIRPDVIHAVHDPQNSYARLAARVARCGVVVGSIRCTELPRRTIRRERLTHRLGAALVVNSVGIRDELVKRAHIASHRIDIVENGVDAMRFRPLSPEERRVHRERFGMRGFVIGVLARVARQKNQLAIVRAVADLRARGAWRDAAIIFAGRDEPHTRYGEEVRAAIRETGVGDSIRVIEPVRDVEHFVGACDATLLASKYEGLPNAVLESLASGTPAIVSCEANTDALVEDDATGFVIDRNDADGVARAIMRAMDSRVLGEMGVLARAKTVSRFPMARMIDATCAIYERALREHR